MRLKLRLIRKSRKAFDTATIARLLRHEDEHGMGRIFMYAFVNEVIRQKTPFPFDCESAQVNPNLMIVDKQGRGFSVEHKCNRLSLTLNDQCTEALTHIEYKGKAYRQVVLDWLAACIRYTSLQPELRKELTRYVHSIKRTTIQKDISVIGRHIRNVYKKGISLRPVSLPTVSNTKTKLNALFKSNNCLQSHSA